MFTRVLVANFGDEGPAPAIAPVDLRGRASATRAACRRRCIRADERLCRWGKETAPDQVRPQQHIGGGKGANQRGNVDPG